MSVCQIFVIFIGQRSGEKNVTTGGGGVMEFYSIKYSIILIGKCLKIIPYPTYEDTLPHTTTHYS